MRAADSEPACLVLLDGGDPASAADPAPWHPLLRRLRNRWLLGDGRSETGVAEAPPAAGDGSRVVVVVADDPETAWTAARAEVPSLAAPDAPDAGRRDPGTGVREDLVLGVDPGTCADELRDRLREVAGGVPRDASGADWFTVTDSQWGFGDADARVLHATFGPVAGAPAAVRRDRFGRWVLDVSVRHLTRLQARDWAEALHAPSAAAPRPAGLAPAVAAAFLDGGDEALISDAASGIAPHEVEAATAALARDLRRAGVVPREPVLLHLGRGVPAVVGVLGIMRAGAVVAPVDPSLPEERIRMIASISGARLAVGEPVPGCFGVDVVPVPSRGAVASGCDDAGRWHDWGPDDPLYLLFTSGSTGTPKGVAMSYRCVDTLVAWHRSIPRRVIRPVVAQFASLGFDVSFQEMLSTLAEGGRIRVVPDEARHDPAELCRWIGRTGVDTLYCPAVVLRELAAVTASEGRTMPTLRRLLHAGEALVANPALLALLRAHPGVVLHNQYGPTETHVVTDHPVDVRALRPGPVPLGRSPWDGACVVLDDGLHPAGPGEEGELYVREPHTALGYWGDATRTAAAFVPDPDGEGGRMYRTGDRVRRSADGRDLEFIGRGDDQVKIRGHRVEPAEIGVAADSMPGVRQVVTAVRADGPDHWIRLIAEADPAVTADAVREHLHSRLPAYAVPREVLVVDALPRTASGKLDRRAEVVSREAAPGTGPDGVSPIRRAWAEALGCSPDAPGDFLSLGGDSLGAMRLALELRMLTGRDIGIGDILGAGGGDDLERLLAGDQGDVPAPMGISPAPAGDDGWFPLLDQQQAYLIGRDATLRGGAVSCHLYLEYRGPREALDVDRFVSALRTVVARHPMLRTEIDPETGLQKVLEESPGIDVPVRDVPDAAAAAEGMLPKMSRSVPDPSRPPLIDVVVLRDDSEVRVCMDVDALVADARSIHTLLEEIDEAYATGDVAAEPPSFTIRDYVESHRRWCAGEGAAVRERDMSYWRRMVSELPPPPALPAGGGPARVAGFRHRRHDLPADIWSGIRERARARGVTPSGVVLAAYACALANWSGSRRFVLNVPRFGRSGTSGDLDRVVGEFASFTLLDVDVRDDGSFLSAARRIQRRLHDDLAHSSVSGMEVLREIFRQRGASDEPVAPCVFTSELGIGGDLSTFAGGALEQTRAVSQTPQVSVDLQVADHLGSVALRFDVLDPALPDHVVDGVWGNLLELLGSLASDDGWLAPPPPEGPGRALAARGDGGPPATPAAPLTGWIDDRAEDAATWAVTPSGDVSYAELARRARVLDAFLGSRGAGPGEPVAVSASDRATAMICLLSIVHSGRRAVMLDPSAPPARISDLAARAGAAVLLTDRDDCGGCAASVASAADAFGGGVAGDDVAVSRKGGPDPCAAVLFTGGSTGIPKGVQVPRSGLVACVAETTRMCGLTADDRTMLIARPHHDMSTMDVYAVGAFGGVVVVPSGDDGVEWARLVEQHSVTAICAVPAAIELLLEGARITGASLSGLRVVLTGGDWVPPALVSALRRHAPGARVWSIGGPTETTAWNIAHEIDPDPVPVGWSSIPYGTPMSGARYRVLDERGRDRPGGVEGELVVDGPGVMFGYLPDDGRRPSPPAAGVPRVHATGDMGAWREPGILEFLGRRDRQLEIRGHRVEPAEVEAALREAGGVAAAVVVPLADGDRVRALGSAYAGDAEPGDVLAHVRAVLPPHAVPAELIRLEEIPLAPSGKTDRRAVLRILAEHARATDAGVGEADPLALLVADIWAESARLDAVAPEIPLIQAGGDSLAALRAVAMMREVFDPGIPVGIRDLLSGATAGDCARALRSAPDGSFFEGIAASYFADEPEDDDHAATGGDHDNHDNHDTGGGREGGADDGKERR